MTSPRYNSIGVTYHLTRQAEPRIVEQLIKLLDLHHGAAIADIGAGTGNYSFALAELGYNVRAIEPSLIMRSQAMMHPLIKWYDAYAEAIPLPDRSVNGVICTLALHHFKDMLASIIEMRRICEDGPIVLFTFDPRQGEHFWLFDYFPAFNTDAERIFPPIEQVASQFANGGRCHTDIYPFPLPVDLLDNFCAANWQNPNRYLDPTIRAGISSFACAEPEAVRRGLTALVQDLATGRWKMLYGDILNKNEFDAGYRFLRVRPIAHIDQTDNK